MGKTTFGMNGTTVYPACNISVCKPGKQFCHRKPSDEELHEKVSFISMS